MSNLAINHLKTLYGLDPNIMPFALQFPRLPPELLNTKSMHNLSKEQINVKRAQLIPQLKDYKEMYQKFVSYLIDGNLSSLIPPGHPLYTNQNSIDTLRAENNKIKKENADLKKQLDGQAREKLNAL